MTNKISIPVIIIASLLCAPLSVGAESYYYGGGNFTSDSSYYGGGNFSDNSSNYYGGGVFSSEDSYYDYYDYSYDYSYDLYDYNYDSYYDSYDYYDAYSVGTYYGSVYSDYTQTYYAPINQSYVNTNYYPSGQSYTQTNYYPNTYTVGTDYYSYNNAYTTIPSSYPNTYPAQKRSEPMTAKLTGPKYSHKSYDTNYDGPVSLSNGKSLAGSGQTTVAVAQLPATRPYYVANQTYGYNTQPVINYPQVTNTQAYYPAAYTYVAPVASPVSPVLASQQYVALSQIPYTGFDGGPWVNALYWIALMLVAALGAYGILHFRGGISAVMDSFRIPELVPAFALPRDSGYTGLKENRGDVMRLVHTEGGAPRIVIVRS